MSGSEGLETEVTSHGLSSPLPSFLLSTCRGKHHKTIRPKGPAPLAQWQRGLFSLSGSFLVSGIYMYIYIWVLAYTKYLGSGDHLYIFSGGRIF